MKFEDNVYTRFVENRLLFEIEKAKFEEQVLKDANAGLIYYDMSNPVTRYFTDEEGNQSKIVIGQWRETNE